MTSEKPNTLIRDVVQGKVKASAAIAQLVASGLSPFDAREEVFIALGGGDIIDGDRYYHSKKLVSEVRQRMKE